jgi:hypothetical protein
MIALLAIGCCALRAPPGGRETRPPPAAAACAPAFAGDAEWEEAAPAWVAAFARAPFLQQRPDFVRMSTERKLDVAEWLPLSPLSHDVRWRKWYVDLGEEALPPLFARLRDEHDERARASLLEVADEYAAAHFGWRPSKAEREALMQAADSLCDPARRRRAVEVLQDLLR